MAEQAEKQTGSENPELVPAEEFAARIAAARAHVNELLEKLGAATLPDTTPAPEAKADTAAELSALEFLETTINPEAYRDYPCDMAAKFMATGRRAGLKMLAEARGEPAPVFEKPEAPPATREDEESEIAQWEAARHAEAAENGGLIPLCERDAPPGGWRHARLTKRSDAAPARGADETEAQLNGLIGECRVLMREVAMQSARLAIDAHDRVRFIESACRVAETGAAVGKTITRLRKIQAGQGDEVRKQRVVFEYHHSRPAADDVAEAPPSP